MINLVNYLWNVEGKIISTINREKSLKLLEQYLLWSHVKQYELHSFMEIEMIKVTVHTDVLQSSYLKFPEFFFLILCKYPTIYDKRTTIFGDDFVVCTINLNKSNFAMPYYYYMLCSCLRNRYLKVKCRNLCCQITKKIVCENSTINSFSLLLRLKQLTQS